MFVVTALRQMFDLLSARDRRRAGWLVALMLVKAVTELTGVASLVPLVAVASRPGLAQSNPWLAWLHDSLGFSSDGAFLVFLAVAFVALFVLTNAVNAVTFYQCYRFCFRLSHELACRLLAVYLCRPYPWFLRQNSSELAKNLLGEVDRTVASVILVLVTIAARGLTVLFLCVGLLWLDPLVAVTTAVATSALYVLIYRHFNQRMNECARGYTEANRLRFKTVLEGLSAMREARALARGPFFLEAFRGHSRRYNDLMAAEHLIGNMPSYVTEPLAIAAIVAVLVYFAARGQAESSVAMASLYIMATWRLVPALQKIYENAVGLRVNVPLLARIHAELTGEGEAVRPRLWPRLPLRQALRLEEVSFAYGDVPVVRQVSLEIPRGTSAALVGRSGAGKTTLADLAAGLLVPQEGRVTVDGQPLEGEALRRWQGSVGYVPQEIYLLDDTVRRNIALGVPDEEIDEEAVMRAATMAHIHDFIVGELPQGYDTVLGERGVILSGGQRQRIGIARALYMDPELLILDEATSSLDNLTERSVIEAIEELAGRKTLLVIAHRLSTVKGCDRIFLVEEGRVVDSGPFAQLLAASAPFQELARLQLLGAGEG
ncbi:MAG TPA: ABC transporter ATP-binding protein [Candidatus Nitrosotenuis sp.]|nr:ABC transporter ATP-binding protein [Candidatus Nitrosotenuis sp.]